MDETRRSNTSLHIYTTENRKSWPIDVSGGSGWYTHKLFNWFSGAEALAAMLVMPAPYRASGPMQPKFWCCCEVTHVRQLLDSWDRIRTPEARKSSRVNAALRDAATRWRHVIKRAHFLTSSQVKSLHLARNCQLYPRHSHSRSCLTIQRTTRSINFSGTSLICNDLDLTARNLVTCYRKDLDYELEFEIVQFS